jgi:hypothetical protein
MFCKSEKYSHRSQSTSSTTSSTNLKNTNHELLLVSLGLDKNQLKTICVQILVEMATGTNPLGFAVPNPYP